MPAPYIKSVLQDQSTRVNSVGSVYTGIVIAARKGPENKPYLITNQTQFLNVFTPNNRIEIGWDNAYQDAYFLLRDTNKLYVTRAASATALYGGCVIKQSTSENQNIALSTGLADPNTYDFQDDDAFLIYGNSPGSYNNDIAISVITDQTTVRLEGAFQIRVYNNTTLVETHTVSLNPELKNGYGVNCYLETVLESSNFIRGIVAPLTPGVAIPEVKAQTESNLALAGGSDGTAVTDAERITALKTLNNVNDIPLQLLVDGGNTTAQFQQAMLDVCTARGESTFALMSTPYEAEVNSDALTELKEYRNETLNANTYLAALYTPHCQVYDEFNDRNIYISPSALVAGRVVQTVQNYGWQFPAAGYNRGIVNAIDVAAYFTPDQIDELSDNQINTLMKDPGYGIVVYDQQTLRSIASDLQEQSISCYINVQLRPALKESLKGYLFELNDEETRSDIYTMIYTYMQSQQAARAVYEFRVVCDETNNSDDDIQNNRLNVWVYLKPTKPAKFIEQKIIVTPYSVDLESIEI